MAQGFGGGVITRIAQLLLLPPKAWILRSISGVAGVVIAVLTYYPIWFPGYPIWFPGLSLQ